jgi:hypothetical protein
MLRVALATIHRDPQWWKTMLIGGALTLTLVGYPLVAGLVMESMDNSRRGYPTPLPPWQGDWGTRYLVGLFALLIDFLFFGMPLMLAAFASICLGIAVTVGSANNSTLLALASGMPAGLVTLLWLALFLGSVSPVARLLYSQEGRIEEALSGKPLRLAATPRHRGPFWRARLASLPAYLPAAVLGGVLLWLAQWPFAGCVPLLLLLTWLAASALLYAHLVVVQLYVAAFRTI